jgi:hypothetical protein
MSKTTPFASGRIARAHELVITLEEPDSAPPAVLIHWPDDATVTTPTQLQPTVNRCMNILARASVRLTHLRRETRR